MTLVRWPSPFSEVLSLRQAVDRLLEESLVRGRTWVPGGSTMSRSDGSTMSRSDGSTMSVQGGSTMSRSDGSTMSRSDGSTILPIARAHDAVTAR